MRCILLVLESRLCLLVGCTLLESYQEGVEPGAPHPMTLKIDKCLPFSVRGQNAQCDLQAHLAASELTAGCVWSLMKPPALHSGFMSHRCPFINWARPLIVPVCRAMLGTVFPGQKLNAT